MLIQKSAMDHMYFQNFEVASSSPLNTCKSYFYIHIIELSLQTLYCFLQFKYF